MMKDSARFDHKNAATESLKLVTAGRIEEAFQKFVDMHGRHHNCFFPAGLATLIQAMLDNHKQFPVKRFDIKNVLVDGKMVAVHSHLRFKEEDPGMVTVHILRFASNKIVEFWDCGQQIPAEISNKDGAF